MAMVLSFVEAHNERARRDIAAKKLIKAELLEFCRNRSLYALHNKLKHIMLNAGLNHIKYPRLNLEVWMKSGALIFDILDHNAVSIDDNCPYCGEGYWENASILYIHQGLRHERHVYGCKCGRFYSITWEDDKHERD